MCHHQPRIVSTSLKFMAVLGVMGILLLGATVPRVEAGIGGSDTPTYPPAVTVGQVINASLTVVNLSTSPNDTENVKLVSLFLIPACKVTSGGSVCEPAANQDPGVFAVLTATGNGATTPCAGIGFTVGAPAAGSGEVQLTPQSDVILGPALGLAAARTCTVDLTLRVLKVPANPVPTPPACTGGGPICTDPITSVSLVGVGSTLNGGGSGSAQVTVSPVTPILTTTSNPSGTALPQGTTVSDSVTVAGPAGAATPTGSVAFFLCQPSEVTAAGCPSGGTQVGTAKTLSAGGSATSDSTSNTQTPGNYCWRAQYNGDSSYAAVSHTNNTTECFNIATPPLVFSTRPNPPSGTVLQTDLGDIGIISGGNNPTGTITFNLFSPADPGCTGAPVFTSVVPVNGPGQYLSGTFPAAQVNIAGVWNWTAIYSGDANNPPAESLCGTEPVDIKEVPVPTLSEWGMILFVMILVGVGSLMLGRRRKISVG